jgi:hypothetical protein
MLVEVMRADASVHPQERLAVLNALRDRFALDDLGPAYESDRPLRGGEFRAADVAGGSDCVVRCP